MRASKIMNSIHQEYVGPRPNRTGNNSELITEYCALHVIHQEYVDHDQTSQKYSYDIVLCTFGAEHRVRNFRFCFFSCVIMTRPSIWTTTKQNWKQLRTHRKCFRSVLCSPKNTSTTIKQNWKHHREVLLCSARLAQNTEANDVRNFRFCFFNCEALCDVRLASEFGNCSGSSTRTRIFSHFFAPFPPTQNNMRIFSISDQIITYITIIMSDN